MDREYLPYLVQPRAPTPAPVPAVPTSLAQTTSFPGYRPDDRFYTTEASYPQGSNPVDEFQCGVAAWKPLVPCLNSRLRVLDKLVLTCWYVPNIITQFHFWNNSIQIFLLDFSGI